MFNEVSDVESLNVLYLYLCIHDSLQMVHYQYSTNRVICGELIPITVFDGVGPIGEFTL